MINELSLESLGPCFTGIVPASMSTCSRDGTPNVSFVSHVYYVDTRHVAISFQFFNKTKKNIVENPHACVLLHDPRTLEGYRLHLRFVRSEESGPLFDAMSLQLDAIASHVGMRNVFRLLAADVYEVLRIERVIGGTPLTPEKTLSQPPAPFDLDALRVISERLSHAGCLGELLDFSLELLAHFFGFQNSILLLADETGEKLLTLASHGYPEHGVGSEVRMGEGLIGTVAASRRPIRLSGVEQSLSYARAIRERARETTGDGDFRPEIPLPGLTSVSSQMAAPLLVRGELVGVLVLERAEAVPFRAREETLLSILAQLLAPLILQLRQEPDEALPTESSAAVPALSRQANKKLKPLHLRFFHGEDCVFVNGEYLIRNVPGKILWRILTQCTHEGTMEFTNRSLRLDPWLGLPEFKDNLESRLILLRKRLEAKCPEIRLVPTARGRFRLELHAELAMTEQGGK